jgi:hypothetical protein
MKKSPLLSLLALASTMALQAQAPPVGISNWSFSGNVQGIVWDEDCKFTIDAAHKITGTCKVQDTEYPVTGTLDGTMLSFTHATDYQGSPYTLMFHGKIAADGAVTGDVDASPGEASGTFSGKQKPAVAK